MVSEDISRNFDKNKFRPLERYRVEGNVVVIEMALQEPSDIYDDKDPSPLRMRDFKKEVEKYITDCIREIPHAKKLRVEFYFYEFSNEAMEKELLKKSYHDFFAFEIKIKRFELREKIKRGIKSLLIGSTFLFFCILISHLIKDHNDSIFKSFFLEGLNVLGWVSLWNPVQVFLYEIWPIVKERKIMERALHVDVAFKNVEHIPDNRKYI